jgi:hypothetical protein
VQLRADSTDIADHRVVEFALVLNLMDHAANLMVGVGGVPREDLCLARVQFLLNYRERISHRQLRATIGNLIHRAKE